MCDFDRQYSFDSYLLNLSLNFIKMATFEKAKSLVFPTVKE